jgi:hypothetical protein
VLVLKVFFCIVCTSLDFHMQPQFYYTSEELEDYMKIAICKRWDTIEVGTNIEAFAVAGSNVLSKLCTASI